jgi:hypothetical protein
VTDGRLAHFESLDEVVDAHLLVPEKTKNAETSPVGEAFEQANGLRRNLFAREFFRQGSIRTTSGFEGFGRLLCRSISRHGTEKPRWELDDGLLPYRKATYRFPLPIGQNGRLYPE